MDKMRVVGYKRVSTFIQMEDGYSLEYQQSEIERYCHEHNLELVQIYADEGKSGTKLFECDQSSGEETPFREGVLAMLDRIKQGDIGAVVVFATNRLWRSTEASLYIRSKLVRANVEIISLTEPTFKLLGQSPADELMMNIMVSVSSYEVAEITAKMKLGRLSKAKQGGYAGGRVPYGYKCDRHDKRLSLYEPEAEAVREVFIMYSMNPTMTLRDVAAIMNILGYTGRNGKPFSLSLGYSIIKRADFYLFGIYEYGGVVVQGQHPLIFGNKVDPDVIGRLIGLKNKSNIK